MFFIILVIMLFDLQYHGFHVRPGYHNLYHPKGKKSKASRHLQVSTCSHIDFISNICVYIYF